MDDNLDPNEAPSNGGKDKEPVQEPIDPYLLLEETNDICLAAYNYIRTIAYATYKQAESSPSREPFLEAAQMFHNLPSRAMRDELSLDGSLVEILPEVLIAIMFDVERWASLMSHMVYRASSHVPPDVFQKLGTIDGTILKTLMVEAEIQLPTPVTERREFRFLRYLKKRSEDMWVIVDLSIDYFSHPSDCTSELNSRRRPSGVLIRRHENHSQVMWIENVEVPECQSQDCIYAGIIKSKAAFGAKAWIGAIVWGVKRNYNRRLITAKMTMNDEDQTRMRKLAESMRMVYLEIIRGTPDETKWLVISNEDVWVMMYALKTPDHLLGLINYVAVTSFRVQEDPFVVYEILLRKSLRLKKPDLGEPQEVIKSVSGYDDGYSITLYKEGTGYILQEASKNVFCSFIISIPITEDDLNSSIFDGKYEDYLLQPSGFVLMVDGDASLVTIAVNKKIDVEENDKAVESMKNLTRSIIRDIRKEAFAVRTKAEHLVKSMRKACLIK